MKKLNQIMVLLLVIAFGFTSCNSDDGGTSIEGRWEHFRDGVSFNGSEQLGEYQHTATCNKDYIEFVNGGVLKSIKYYIGPNGCQNNTETGAWVRDGNQVTITYGSVTSIYEILIIDNSTLKIRKPNTQLAGSFIIEVYKR